MQYKCQIICDLFKALLSVQFIHVDFFAGQGRTRVCGEAYFSTPQPEIRGERCPAGKRTQALSPADPRETGYAFHGAGLAGLK